MNAFPWEDLLTSEEAVDVITNSKAAVEAARKKALDVIERQEKSRKKLSWLAKMFVPYTPPEDIKKGKSPMVYDAALDAFMAHDFQELLATKEADRMMKETFNLAVKKIDEAPEEVQRMISSTLLSTFFAHFSQKLDKLGANAFEKALCRPLLDKIKGLRPYVDRKKRELRLQEEARRQQQQQLLHQK